MHQEPRPSSLPVKDVTRAIVLQKLGFSTVKFCAHYLYPKPRPTTSATSVATSPDVSEFDTDTAQNWLPDKSSPVNTWLT